MHTPFRPQVLQRAQACGVGPIVAYTTDFDKAETLMRCARENSGLVYCAMGIASDNIKRTNDRCVLPRGRHAAHTHMHACIQAVRLCFTR